MRKILIVLLFIFASNVAKAQFIKNKAINAQIGYGLSMPYNSDSDIGDDGILLQGEYVMAVTSWFELRPYAGFIFTKSNGKDLDDNLTDEMAESKAMLIGGKARVRVPIRWIAPYVESGIGGSIGKFETLTAYTNINKSGLIFHIPFSLGLELGRNNDVDLSFNYYFQPAVEQMVGAFALGISIPLKN
tara:strand:+ start:4614 stop:5177 length:564 start_codon:yes stop_codon:yes gene_type:complete